MRFMFYLLLLVSFTLQYLQAQEDSNNRLMQSSGGIIHDTDDYESAEFWVESAQQLLKQKISDDEKIIGKAQNIILFLGDGWGITTLTASRILKGQEVDKGVKWGEEASLHVDTFPFSGLSKTFCSDYQTGESACTATAYLGGSKAKQATIGLKPNVTHGNCSHQQDTNNHISSILSWAQKAGKATGIISTSPITDASGAATFAHSSNRNWETDADVVRSGESPDVCHDIAKQLVFDETGRKINVILGGGRSKFLPQNYTDIDGQPGSRLDGRNLIDTWLQEKLRIDPTAKLINRRNELLEVNASVTNNLMGLFSSGGMHYFHDQHKNNQPTLEEMTEKAIEILSRNPSGFFLFVEGGRIDDAHHSNKALRSLWESIEFDKAIKKADDLTNNRDTLIVATADHSHAFSMAGYAKRGNPIWEFGGIADDGIQTQTLNYANGPGWKPFTEERRHDIGKDDVSNIDYQQVPLVLLGSETHGAEDVGIFAKGPFAHLLTGVVDQNFIPHVMGYAGCIGIGLKYCDEKINAI